MSKKKSTPLNVFMESLKLYFSNFDKFIKYMTFPVLGQFLGLFLTLTLSYFYAVNLPSLVEKIPALNNFSTLFLFAILICLPGLAVFLKAFWEYLVAYGAVNSMLENMLKSGKVYDFDAHTELIKRRTIPFIGLWALVGLFSLLSLIPFFWVPCAVFAVFFVLIFQVFTYEPEQTPLGCVKRSLQLVKGHFAYTFLLIVLAGALTYFLIPQIAKVFCDYTHITLALSNAVKPFIKLLPIAEWNNILAYVYLPPLKLDEVAMFVVSTFIAQIFIQYTLPLRSILCGVWYKSLNGGKLGANVDSKKKAKSKRPSDKLMEESHKKFTSKKLDRNILRRAMEKDSED